MSDYLQFNSARRIVHLAGKTAFTNSSLWNRGYHFELTLEIEAGISSLLESKQLTHFGNTTNSWLWNWGPLIAKSTNLNIWIWGLHFWKAMYNSSLKIISLCWWWAYLLFFLFSFNSLWKLTLQLRVQN